MSAEPRARRERPGKLRADLLLVRRGLAESRERAQALILAGVVLAGGQRVEKAGDRLPEDVDLSVARDPNPYVSRGGLKLAGALDALGIDPRGWTVLDVGSSTGGFVDCLLQRGAGRVIALDVGRGQLHWRLRQDPRVTVREGINARHLSPGTVEGPVDLVTLDVSFISLRLVLGPVLEAAGPRRWMALVKPQFEVGRAEVERGGRVTDPAKHRRVVGEVLAAAADLGLAARGVVASPLPGAEGNREFFLHLEAGGAVPDAAEVERWIAEATA